METKVIQSKQFSLNWRDLGRGFLAACIGAVLPIVQSALVSWMTTEDFKFDWKLIIGTGLMAGISYLILNFSSQSKVITVPGTGIDLKDTVKDIKKVV